MADVKHPKWKCDKCGTVIHFAGATSHMNRCTAKPQHDENGDRVKAD